MQRVAYAARRGDQWLIVVDDAEGKAYDGIGGGRIFSPDGRHVAYAEKRGGKRLVGGGVEGEEYDVLFPGSKLVIERSRYLYTLVGRNNEILRVEATIK